MSTFKATNSTAAPRDLFYPNVLTPDMKLEAGAVQDSFRRVFDMLYKINPPPGSRDTSSVFTTDDFAETFTVNLANNIFFLSGENWNSSTAGVSWNSHTLTYHGTAYTIAAGGPTTNKYIYWDLADATKYKTSATFPTMDTTNPADGSTASGLVAVWNASDGKLYPFWSAKMAPAFIATALIEDLAVTNAKIQDLQASKITAGTLAAGVIYAGSITADQITAGTLTVTITITGGKIRTASSGARIELDNSIGLTQYNSGGILTGSMDLNGTIKTNLLMPANADPGTLTIGAGTSSAGTVSIGARNDALAGGALLLGSSSIVASVNSVSELSINNTYGLQIVTHGIKIDTSGQGIQWIDTNSSAIVATASAIDLYTKVGASRTNTGRFDNTSHATNSNLWLYWNGTLKQVIVNTILGINYLTV